MVPENGKTETSQTSATRDLYPVNEVAYKLGVTPRKVWSLIADGRLKTKRLDGRRLVPADVLAEFINNLPVADNEAKAS